MRRTAFFTVCGALAAGASRASAATPVAAFDGRTTVPVVRARVGTRDLTLVIDTGDALSTLSESAADAIGLVKTTPASNKPVTGMLTGVTLAGSVLRSHTAIVTPAASWSQLIGFAVDGSLGYDAFKDRVVTLDFKNRRLFFPDVMPEGERASITWMKYHDRSPQLVTFEGLSVDATPLVTQLDTAMAKTAILFTTKLPDVTILPEAKAPLYTYEEAALAPGRVGSLRLGRTLLAASPLVYAAGANAHVPTTAINAVAGDQLFAQRAVTIDFPGSTLIVS
ncbi:MAG TPA: hypothetical protein VGC96_05780 [Candidatus Elarobacter sp.]|jgi:hypothetical protein